MNQLPTLVVVWNNRIFSSHAPEVCPKFKISVIQIPDDIKSKRNLKITQVKRSTIITSRYTSAKIWEHAYACTFTTQRNFIESALGGGNILRDYIQIKYTQIISDNQHLIENYLSVDCSECRRQRLLLLLLLRVADCFCVSFVYVSDSVLSITNLHIVTRVSCVHWTFFSVENYFCFIVWNWMKIFEEQTIQNKKKINKTNTNHSLNAQRLSIYDC